MVKENNLTPLFRIIAFLIDFFMIIFTIATIDKHFEQYIGNGEGFSVVWLMFVLVPMGFFLYWSLRINLGKRIFKLKILDAQSGKPATIFQLFKRSLPFSLLISLNVIFLIPFFISKRNQGFHDMFAKTIVTQMKIGDKCNKNIHDGNTNQCDINLENIPSNISPTTISHPKSRLILTHQMLSAVKVAAALLILAAIVFIYKQYINIGSLIVVSLLIASFLNYVVSNGIKNEKSWSKTASTIIAFTYLIAVPIGTIIGIFMLVNLFSKDWNSERSTRNNV